MTMELFSVSVLVYLGVLLSVAYFTLMERKCLSSLGIRLGPDKTSIGGMTQPVTDGLKLIVKEFVAPTNSVKVIFMIVPCVALALCFAGWQIFPTISLSSSSSNDLLFFLVVSSLNAHVAIMSGWSSSSKYASVGGVRGFAQVISYEICLSITLVVVMFFAMTMSFFSLSESGWSLWWCMYCFPVALLWLTVCLAEANRAPFDLVEAESELVSGFNIEFSAGGFAALFIAEYGMILLMCLVTVMSFFQNACIWTLAGSTWMFVKMSAIVFFFIWSRASFPRFRYDQLMLMAWKSLLPFVLGVYCAFFILSKI
uniref:NADH-ubiquinone oxidoreductase chain 1 n=1 Tax=Crassostrea tulipa TaxID=2912563 RepID=A0A0K0PWG5_9BIVA|nr:NADH dehydrogenase subunit 1 [Crassostrea gasar]AKQ78435.1 NADH dehydrogenase subunit 1 [Crassostrea gasar]